MNIDCILVKITLSKLDNGTAILQGMSPFSGEKCHTLGLRREAPGPEALGVTPTQGPFAQDRRRQQPVIEGSAP